MSEFPEAISQSLPGGRTLKRIDGERDRVPAYAASDDAPRGVPTGRILVRFSEGMRFDQHAASIAAAGFVVEAALSYAPHAGWVRAASGDIADALRYFDRLASIPGVQHVEPQLLYTRVLKKP
jgi:hypothetical protein